MRINQILIGGANGGIKVRHKIGIPVAIGRSVLHSANRVRDGNWKGGFNTPKCKALKKQKLYKARTNRQGATRPGVEVGRRKPK
jgi:hypothetical protein